jgi:hypothetical protein
MDLDIIDDQSDPQDGVVAACVPEPERSPGWDVSGLIALVQTAAPLLCRSADRTESEASSMLTLRERLAVVNLYEELGSYRAVAAVVGDHKTVNAWLDREQRGERARRRPRATDPYLPLIRSKLQASQGELKSKPLLRVLPPAGHTASLRARVLRRTDRPPGRPRRSTARRGGC